MRQKQLWNQDRLTTIGTYYMKHGMEAACQQFNLKDSTVRRYLRAAALSDVNIHANTIMSDIRERFTDDELRMLAKGGTLLEREIHKPTINFNGEHIKVGGFSDPHIGSIYTEDWMLDKMFSEFEKEQVDFITCSGDVTEGMSNRQGHMYECSHLGYAAQASKATEIFNKYSKCPIYMIDGNHDRWYIKSNGAKIVEDICGRVPHAEFLGHDEGSIDLNGNAELRLWHGEDGNSYATSYRVQKILEALTGGDKPNIILCGHTHKQFYMYERMVHAYSMGSIQKQSKWMRGKRIPAHTGFWIIDIWVNCDGVGKIGGVWYPFYR